MHKCAGSHRGPDRCCNVCKKMGWQGHGCISQTSPGLSGHMPRSFFLERHLGIAGIAALLFRSASSKELMPDRFLRFFVDASCPGSGDARDSPRGKSTSWLNLVSSYTLCFVHNEQYYIFHLCTVRIENSENSMKFCVNWRRWRWRRLWRWRWLLRWKRQQAQ